MIHQQSNNNNGTILYDSSLNIYNISIPFAHMKANFRIYKNNKMTGKKCACPQVIDSFIDGLDIQIFKFYS